MYFVAPLSKIFTAAGICILVDEKKLESSTPVSSLLPEFDHPDESIRKESGPRTPYGPPKENQMW